jgi:carboxyl-terminal processing protease
LIPTITFLRGIAIMIRQIFPAKRLAMLGAVALCLLIPRSASAQPNPGTDDKVIAQKVCFFLEKGHVTQPKIGEDISRKLFRRFLKDLDPGKVYFTQSDIDDFKKRETELGDMLLKGDISHAYKVFGKFLERVDQRLKLIDELTNTKFDFTVKEYLDTDTAKIEFANSDKELAERWRKRIKFDLLRERIGTKPLPEAEAAKKVRDRYHSFARRMKQLDNHDIVEVYLSSLAASLDPHGAFMSPSTLGDFKIAMQASLQGIGAMLREENGQCIIVEVVPGGAAARDGRLKANDKIIAVAQGDGKFVDVVDMRLRDTVKLIRGKKGTTVELKVIPAGKLEPVAYTLTRDQVDNKSQAARYEIIEQGKKDNGKPYRFGVIDLPSFYGPGGLGSDIKGTSRDVERILKRMTTSGVDGVILDLRGNGGGLLNESLALAGLFIDEGPIVQVKDQIDGIQSLNDPKKGVAYDGPLMVLINRGSASASEIVAGALQDYGRAVIVGDSATHGKGTVQQVIDIGRQVRPARPEELGALRLTMQQFYRVNGDSTQCRGVASDIVIPSLTEYLSTPEKDMEYCLPFDSIKPVDFQAAGAVTAELKSLWKARSAERIKNSKDFAKLAKDIERAKGFRERKRVPLNEEELKAQMSKEEADENDPEKGPEKKDNTTYKFPRNFTSDEILKIMEDVVQGKKLLSTPAPKGTGALWPRLDVGRPMFAAVIERRLLV